MILPFLSNMSFMMKNTQITNKIPINANKMRIYTMRNMMMAKRLSKKLNNLGEQIANAKTLLIIPTSNYLH
jgi:hypothetical protein